ncbi:bark storage protein A-like isoform X1 [Prosopis cineraria]|uniref:bark storage protein A-like isoform X1 n=1 Tax=Prosopis cineraria TaxID=364024 RepID=UPI00240FA16D|nr:bark storage protein A-like isoform X1 [Prosopis cineraria]XP_054812807.1 bark storage protein A-like isoform X1 [Prosopis cineraria]
MGTRILVILLLSLTAEFAVSLCRSKAVQVMKELKLKGPYFGIIAAYPPEEIAFFASKAFKPDPKHPFVELSGRLYWVGKIFDKKVIFVRCGVGMLNAAAVTQQMIDVFDVIGILHFGIAGSANDSISFGDVTIPKQFIHTGLWDWLKPNGTLESSDFARLDFGNFNVPKGKNLLGRVGYSSEEFFSVTGKPNLSQRLIWAKVTSQWLQLAATLEGIQLEQCINSSFCLPHDPKLVIGVNGTSADIYVDNEAYRDFLFQTFQVSSVDMESFPVVMTCLSNGFPVIVIRGISDMAGKNGDEAIDTFGALAATNAVTVLLHLLKILPSSHHHYISLLNS